MKGLIDKSLQNSPVKSGSVWSVLSNIWRHTKAKRGLQKFAVEEKAITMVLLESRRVSGKQGGEFADGLEQQNCIPTHASINHTQTLQCAGCLVVIFTEYN